MNKKILISYCIQGGKEGMELAIEYGLQDEVFNGDAPSTARGFLVLIKKTSFVAGEIC